MFTPIQPMEISGNAIARIGRQWMLVTAGNRSECNTMTASWGGVGFLWNRPVATIYVRPQRYTREFLDREGWFSLSFLPERYRAQLTLCGRESGRDMDKIKACDFSVEYGRNDTPYIAQAELALTCKTLYMEPLKPGSFLDSSLPGQFYPQEDWSRIYIGEIVEALENRGAADG
ncbi:MAG: flavin reductase [Oscillospiraceae bacterium]|nr:flavin reductase [Oscillospiraceae bacterium]